MELWKGRGTEGRGKMVNVSVSMPLMNQYTFTFSSITTIASSYILKIMYTQCATILKPQAHTHSVDSYVLLGSSCSPLYCRVSSVCMCVCQFMIHYVCMCEFSSTATADRALNHSEQQCSHWHVVCKGFREKGKSLCFSPSCPPLPFFNVGVTPFTVLRHVRTHT